MASGMTKPKKTQGHTIYELVSHPKKRMQLFRTLPVNNQGFVLLSLSRNLRVEIIKKLKHKELLALLHYLDPDEVTDLLQAVTPSRRKRVLDNLGKDIRDKVRFLLRFNPETAAGIMSLDYIEVEFDSTFEEVSGILKRHEARTSKFPTILVVEDGFLKGELPGHVLVLRRPNERIRKHVRKVLSVRYDREEEDIISLFKRNPHTRIVVLDNDNSIMGVVHSDDLLQLIQKESAANLMDFAGVSDEESVHDSALKKVKYRYKWLILNLGTAFLAASVVGLYQETISAFVLLAVYMPIIAGMGGNAGTQTLAVIVRGIALREVELKTGKTVVMREIGAGAINGVINGIIVALVAAFFNHNPMLGLVVGVSMVLNLAVAGLFGAVTPLIMQKIKKDPATSATIFITTATDLFGFFVFLGLATAVLG